MQSIFPMFVIFSWFCHDFSSTCNHDHVSALLASLSGCQVVTCSFIAWTNWPHFEDGFSNVSSLYILIQISIKFAYVGPTGKNKTLGHVMAWCCQATSHYMNKCWPRSIMPYGITVNNTWFLLINSYHSWSKYQDPNGHNPAMYMGQVTKLQLSCYLVLLSNDSKTR